MTYAQPTYNELIDSIHLDMGREPSIALITPEAFMAWILRAEEEICKKLDVPEQYHFRYTEEEGEYSVQDRPAITAITTATPPVVTAAAHGLSNTDVINLREVQGIDLPDGKYRVKSVATNTFALTTFARISSIEAGSSATINTETEHGFSSGDTVTIDGTGIALVDASHTITVTSTTAYTIPVTVSTTDADAYDGGGVGAKNVVGSGTYTVGGRFWKETEVPTMFRYFEHGTRVFGNRTFTVYPKTVEELDRFKMQDGFRSVYHAADSPQFIAQMRRGTFKFVRLYPLPKEDNDLILHGFLQIVPKDYFSDLPTAKIHLSSEYEELIRAFVKARVYESLEKFDSEANAMGKFENKIQEFRLRMQGNPLPMRKLGYK